MIFLSSFSFFLSSFLVAKTAAFAAVFAFCPKKHVIARCRPNGGDVAMTCF